MKRLPGDDPSHLSLLGCTDHMCPVRVHWHVKSNYRDYWRVKVTVSNYHFAYNFSDWNLVIQHPSFGQPALSYSFNSTRLATVGNMGTPCLFNSFFETRHVIGEFKATKYLLILLVPHSQEDQIECFLHAERRVQDK